MKSLLKYLKKSGGLLKGGAEKVSDFGAGTGAGFKQLGARLKSGKEGTSLMSKSLSSQEKKALGAAAGGAAGLAGLAALLGEDDKKKKKKRPYLEVEVED
jgi:hypothetical protein